MNITASQVSKVLGTAFDKSNAGGKVGRSGHWTTEGYSVEKFGNAVAVSYEQDNRDAYSRETTLAKLAEYATHLEARGYVTLLEEYSVPFLSVSKSA